MNKIKIKTVLGYSYLIFLLIAAGLMLAAYKPLSAKLVDFGFKVSDKFMGGKIIEEIDNKDYKILIHEKVFNNSLGDPKKGFVQIDIVFNNKLYETIEKDIDFDRDTAADIKLKLDLKNNKAEYKKINTDIVGLIDKTSFADFYLKEDLKGNNSIIYYKNFTYKNKKYKEGISLRIIIIK